MSDEIKESLEDIFNFEINVKKCKDNIYEIDFIVDNRVIIIQYKYDRFYTLTYNTYLIKESIEKMLNEIR